MNTRKLMSWILMAIMVMTFVVGCSGNSTPATEEATPPQAITLSDVNRFLNESAGLGEGSKANPVAVIPFAHIDGPKNEDDFYAFVNFKFRARNYIKYQVSYISCSCRPAATNYWQTAYVELTLPESGHIEDAEIRTLSYDLDSTNAYLGGFWGDSDPIPDGATYDEFKTQYIPYFVGKDYAAIKGLSIMDDIDLADYQAGEGRSAYTIDTFSGSSVSANNIIRMLQALYEYHGTDEFFTGETAETTPAEEPAAAETSAPAEEASKAPTATVTTTSVDLPAPSDTTKTYKPDKDSDPIACEEDSFSYECSSINKDNFIDYMDLDDVLYIDLRDYDDYMQKHFRNFEVIPFFALVYNRNAEDTNPVQLYSGSTKDPVPTYEESDELLEALFPKDKTLMLVCQSGGRVTMLLDILNSRGWDMSKIYNIGGMAQYTDSKYNDYLVDTLEFNLEGTYSIQGLTPLK